MNSNNTKPIVERFNDNNVKFFALGGLGEVGKNMYVFECSDEIIIVDSGILFPDSTYGIDYLLPDFTYLKDNEDKIVGLFITHGHEDHIGGIPYLLQSVKIPKIYANGLAVGLIKNKQKEYPQLKCEIVEFNDESVYKFKHFEVSFFRTNHSIPDSFGIALLTKYGYILHTGDFKFDLTPLGQQADYHKLTAYAKRGVKLLLSDSTNASIKAMSPSEKEISKNIRTIFSQIKGRIIIATFASNVYRVQQIIEASVNVGRKVIIFGRSMEKTIAVGQSLGYIKAPEGTFIKANEFPHLPPDKITILCTGSQGEPLAALSRIANGTHRQIKLIPGDTVVFSSSPIPGNQESINSTINKLYRAGAEVIVNSPLTDTHTSGHASETELKLMLVLTKPEYFAPIHGEYAMQIKHINLAIQTGIEKSKCFALDLGEVLTINKKGAYVNNMVKSGTIYIDSNGHVIDGTIIKERKLLAEDGMVTAIFTVHKHKQIADPAIVSRGFIYMKNSEQLVSNIQNKAKATLDRYLKTHKVPNYTSVKGFISNELSNFIYELTERKPIIIPIIMEVETA